MSALAVLFPRPNSHPFQERQISVHEPIKIGRSVARARPAPNNAIYDCKVLSRNHALMWYENGKFFLQDTKSSNGTFVNNQRLSKGSEESLPHELYSNDLVQFGVDVMENARRVTHSCIIATVQLFHPDGTEATDNHSSPFLNSAVSGGAAVQPQELYQLAQYLQEALHREQMLENKLATLSRLVRTTQEASESGWQALIDEDRLLSRLEILENQLQAYSKNHTEDTLRQELVALQEDKHKYETTSKESLRRVLQEKLDAVRKLSDLESSLSKSEDECTLLKSLYDTTKQELQELSVKHEEQTKLIESLEEKLQEAEKSHQEELVKMGTQEEELLANIEEMVKQENQLQAKMEVLQAENDFTKEQLANMKAKMETLKEQVGGSPHIRETENTGIQVDLVNLMDLQVLNSNAKESEDSAGSEGEDDVTDSEDNMEKEEKGLEKDSQTKEQLKANLTVCDLEPDFDLDLTALPPEQLKETQEKIEFYKKQLEESEEKLKASQGRIDSLQDELEHAKLEAVKSEEKFSLLEEKLKLPDMHMNQLVENAIADLKIQLSESKKQAESSGDLASQLRGQIALLEAELAEYKDGERSPETPIVPCIPVFSNDLANSNSISNHVDEKTGSNNLKDEIENLKDLLQEAREAQKTSEAEVQKCKCDLEDVESKVKKSETELKSVQHQLTEAQKEATEKGEHVTTLQEKLNKAEHSSKEVKQQIISLRDRLVTEQSRVQVLPEEKSAQRRIPRRLVPQLKAKHPTTLLQPAGGSPTASRPPPPSQTTATVFKRPKSSLPKPVTKQTAQKEQLHQAQQEARRSREEVELLRSQVLDLQDGATSEMSQVKVTELSRSPDVTAVKEECANLRQRIQHIESEIKMQFLTCRSRSENQQLQTDYTRLQESYNELDQLKATLENKEMHWKSNLTDAQKEAEQTKEQLLMAQEEINQLKEQCNQCQQQIQELKEELDASADEYTQLSFRTKTLSHVALLPILVVLFAFLLAFHPFLSGITATSLPDT